MGEEMKTCEELLSEIKARLEERTPELKRKAPSIYLDQVCTNLETLVSIVECAQKALNDIIDSSSLENGCSAGAIANEADAELDRLASVENK